MVTSRKISNVHDVGGANIGSPCQSIEQHPAQADIRLAEIEAPGESGHLLVIVCNYRKFLFFSLPGNPSSVKCLRRGLNFRGEITLLYQGHKVIPRLL